MLLYLQYFQTLSLNIWLAFGTGKSLLFIPAHDTATALDPKKSKALPMSHALTGCNTVSAFVGRGKQTKWALWECFPELTDTLVEVNHKNKKYITESYMSIIARFVILMYDRTSTCSDINTARKKLFANKVRRLESIRPIHHVLTQHVRRAKEHYAGDNLSSHLQVSGVWKKHLTVSLNRFGQHTRSRKDLQLMYTVLIHERMHWSLQE